MWVVTWCAGFFVCFNDTATTEIYTLSLHDALPISAIGAKPSANSARVAPEISKRIDLPSGEGIIFCVLPVPSETTAPVLVWLTLTELLPVTAGLGASPPGAAGGAPDSLIFKGPLPTTMA